MHLLKDLLKIGLMGEYRHANGPVGRCFGVRSCDVCVRLVLHSVWVSQGQGLFLDRPPEGKHREGIRVRTSQPRKATGGPSLGKAAVLIPEGVSVRGVSLRAWPLEGAGAENSGEDTEASWESGDPPLGTPRPLAGRRQQQKREEPRQPLHQASQASAPF